jgi:hypothetical protein
MFRSMVVLSVLMSVAACGEKPAGDAGKKVEAKAPEAKAPEAKAPEAKAPETKEAAPPPAAPVDPATFTAVDLSSVAALAKYTVNGPPGAKVTADPPKLGEKEATGAVVEEDGFKLHLWRSTIGEERTVLPMQANMEGGKYTETRNEGEKGLLEYTLEKGGKTGHAYIQAKFSTVKDGSLLCGNAEPLADAAALEPYRKACESLAEKK